MPMPDPVDLAIIGAGAAGLTAAIFAKQNNPNRRIVLLDSAKKVGAKILVAGGGRCNVTHHQVTARDYHGQRNRIKKVLAAFTVEKTIAWFESLGVILKQEDTGKLFPVTNDAHTVLNALLDRAAQLGVQLCTDHRVHEVAQHDDGGFLITHSQGQTHTHRLILAAGGKSLPRTGSDGSGWTLAKTLGHTITPTYPALAPLVLDDHFFHTQVSGVSHPAQLTTRIHGKRIDQRTGSLLWTHFGISGPVVMDVSRFWIMARAENQDVELRCHLLPGETFDSLERSLIDRITANPKRRCGRVFAELLPQRLVEALCASLHIDTHQEAGRLTRDARRALVHAITDLPLPVQRDRGWNYAEVTAGGVPLEEIDTRTMTSTITPGLQLVGEILNVDGRIGGFNFQWAWATGYVAGHATSP